MRKKYYYSGIEPEVNMIGMLLLVLILGEIEMGLLHCSDVSGCKEKLT